MKKSISVAILVTALMCSSCATIFTGSKKNVTFDGNVRDNITLTIDGRKYNHVTFPYTVKIDGGFDETVVKAEAEGYNPEMLYIDKTFNYVSIINLTDVLGWAIDAATGAIMKPEFKFYEFEMQPISEQE